MEIVVGMHNLKPRHKGLVVTMGTFDGVHHGHQMLLAHLAAKAKELDTGSALITFEPTPREYFGGTEVAPRLTRFREKIVLLRRTELDYVICLPFNDRTRSISAEAVVNDFLHDTLAAKYVVVGDDFRFGKGAVGDYALLKEAGDSLGYGVSHLGTLSFEHERVSSTRVREALGQGDFGLAAKLLGHEYFIMGRVVYGRQLGRELGTRTANMRLQRYRAALEGVFAVTVDEGLDRQYHGIANIGIRPTVDGKEPLLEVHVFDFDADIYGELLTVTFKHKIREEHMFESLDALKAQIGYDIEAAKAWFDYG
jgi:riboflavin kinase/FMN adenylyltransferase